MKTRMMLMSLLSIIIVALSWITNIGFVRVMLSIILLPVVHMIVVFAMGTVASNYADYKKIRVYNFFFCLTYILSNVFYPDADELRTYMFFRLIDNDSMCNAGLIISIIALIIHIALIVLQMIEVRRIDKIRFKGE